MVQVLVLHDVIVQTAANPPHRLSLCFVCMLYQYVHLVSQMPQLDDYMRTFRLQSPEKVRLDDINRNNSQGNRPNVCIYVDFLLVIKSLN